MLNNKRSNNICLGQLVYLITYNRHPRYTAISLHVNYMLLHVQYTCGIGYMMHRNIIDLPTEQLIISKDEEHIIVSLLINSKVELLPNRQRNGHVIIINELTPDIHLRWSKLCLYYPNYFKKDVVCSISEKWEVRRGPNRPYERLSGKILQACYYRIYMMIIY